MYKDLELEGKKIYPLISSGKMDLSKSSGTSLEEISLVYKRLDECRDEINRVSVVRRVNEAYKNWSYWLR